MENISLWYQYPKSAVDINIFSLLWISFSWSLYVYDLCLRYLDIWAGDRRLESSPPWCQPWHGAGCGATSGITPEYRSHQPVFHTPTTHPLSHMGDSGWPQPWPCKSFHHLHWTVINILSLIWKWSFHWQFHASYAVYLCFIDGMDLEEFINHCTFCTPLEHRKTPFLDQFYCPPPFLEESFHMNVFWEDHILLTKHVISSKKIRNASKTSKLWFINKEYKSKIL